MAVRQHKPQQPIEIFSIRSATVHDMADIAGHGPQTRITQLRDAHHLLARFLAAGLTQKEAAYHAGYTAMRVSQLRDDPTFQELVELYRAQDNEKWLTARDHFYDRVVSVRNKALRQIEDQLDEADELNEKVPIARLRELTEMGSDRTGYPKKTINTNVNIDFAAKLEAAIHRSSRARVIEHEAD